MKSTPRRYALLLSLLIFTHASFAKDYIVRFHGDLKYEGKQSLQDYDFELNGESEELDMVFFKSPNQESLIKFIRENSALIKYVEEDHLLHAIAMPNDIYFPQQNGIKRIGVENAWERGTGSNEIIIAVSDTGIKYDHPDLRGNMWVNTREIPNNGIDDDGNGYVDDIHGWNFNKNNNNPMDENGHGTHVAGIIGASSDNNIGVAGVNWNVRLMAVQFLGKNGSGSTSQAIGTVTYAVKQGARVINASWGGGPANRALKDALDFAAKNNVLFLAAAGNDYAKDNDKKATYPAGYDSESVLAVASTQSRGVLSSFSNIGKTTVDLAAPGSNILSTFKDGYQRLSGTSMATPVVAGVAGLVLSEHPNLNLSQLKNALLNATIPHQNFAGKFSTAGEINAHRALTQFDDDFSVWPRRVELAVNKTYQFTVHANNYQPVRWAVSDGTKASINQKGLLTAQGAGTVIVSATLPDGTVAQTDAITLSVVRTSGGGGGGGCVKAANASGTESVRSGFLSVFFYGVLLLMGFAWRRRRFF